MNYKNDDARAPFPALRQINDVLPSRCILATGNTANTRNFATKEAGVGYMPDTKRACTHFLTYVNAFNNGPLRDQQPIREPPPGFHWSLVENAARRIPFENQLSGVGILHDGYIIDRRPISENWLLVRGMASFTGCSLISSFTSVFNVSMSSEWFDITCLFKIIRSHNRYYEESLKIRF